MRIRTRSTLLINILSPIKRLTRGHLSLPDSNRNIRPNFNRHLVPTRLPISNRTSITRTTILYYPLHHLLLGRRNHGLVRYDRTHSLTLLRILSRLINTLLGHARRRHLNQVLIRLLARPTRRIMSLSFIQPLLTLRKFRNNSVRNSRLNSAPRTLLFNTTLSRPPNLMLRITRRTTVF